MQSFDPAASWLRPASFTPTAGTDTVDPIGTPRGTVVTYAPLAGATQRSANRDEAAEHCAMANVGTQDGATDDGAANNEAFANAGKLAAGYGLRPRGTP